MVGVMKTGGLFGSSLNALAQALHPNQLSVGNALAPQAPRDAYGKRVDGTAKGRGFLGELKTPDGQIMTEYSVGVDWGEGEMEIPTIVPTLTPQEIEYLRRGGKPNDAIIDKAIRHARERIAKGFSPFAMRGVDY